MAVRTRIQPLDRDVKLLIDQLLSPAARSRLFAEAAQENLDEADTTNRQVLGRVPRSHTYVDGREGASLASVRPDGVIVREYELVTDVLLFISDELLRNSPVGKGPDKRPGHPGFYKSSHTLFADTVEVPLGGNVPEAAEYVFISAADYARRIEKRYSLYQSVAAMAARRFGNIAKVTFTFRGLVGGQALGKSGPSARKRQTGRWKGRFAKAGGTQAQNVSSARFPAIVVTLGR